METAEPVRKFVDGCKFPITKEIAATVIKTINAETTLPFQEGYEYELKIERFQIVKPAPPATEQKPAAA